MKRLLVLLAVLLLPACSAAAKTHAVSPGELTLALSQAVDGDVIELSEGVYGEAEETFPLTVTHAVTIRAAQDARPVIDAPAFQSAFRVEADGVTLQGVDIAMRRTGIYALGDGLTLIDVSISLADEAWRTSSCGLWMGGVRHATLENCAFWDCSVAMAGPPLSETSHLVPVLTGMFEAGEEPEYFTTHSITGCTVNGGPLFYAANLESVSAPADAGQVIVAGCGRVTVEGADVSNGSMGMQIIYCDDVQVLRCKADDCGVFGIYLAKLGGGAVRESGGEGTNHAIDIRASQNIIVADCYANACDQGIFLSGVQCGLVQDCVVTDTGQGYFLAAGAHCQIDRCVAENCENGMNIQKEHDVLITRCTLTGNTICAARLDGSPTVFVDNTLRDNWVGVMAYGNVSFVLADNVICGSGSCGVYMRDIAYSRLSGNTICASAKASLQAVGEMASSLLTGNRLDRMYELTGGAVLRDENNLIGAKDE